MPYYIVWLKNNTDIRDDAPIKIKAKSREQAKDIAVGYLRKRFAIAGIYTMSEFKIREPWWHSLFWGKKAINEKNEWFHENFYKLQYRR